MSSACRLPSIFDPFKRWLQLRFDFDCFVVRLPFDCNSTALRLFDDLRHDRHPACVWAAALRPK